MLQPDEIRVIDVTLQAVEEGLAQVEQSPSLSSHDGSLVAGSPVTSLTNRFGIKSAVIAALRVRLQEEHDEDRKNFVSNLTTECTEDDALAMVQLYLEAFPKLIKKIKP